MIKPNRRYCCCCTIASDQFNTRNGVLENRWLVKSGSWSVIDNAVSCDNTGYVILDIFHPENSHSMVVYYDILENTIERLKTQDYWIILAYENENKYYLAKYLQRTETTSKIQLFAVAGGNTTLLKEEVIDSVTPIWERRFTAMIADNEFCAQVSGAVNSKVVYNPNLSNMAAKPYYSGFGGSFTEEARIDNFVFSRHAQTKEYCPYCICSCEGHYIKETLYAHITGYDLRMDQLDCTIKLIWNRSDGVWRGSWDTTYHSGECGCGIFAIEMGCDPDGRPTSFSIFVRTSCYQGPTPIELFPLPESTCNPFYLVFEEVYVFPSNLTCNCGIAFIEGGSWQIEITDSP